MTAQQIKRIFKLDMSRNALAGIILTCFGAMFTMVGNFQCNVNENKEEIAAKIDKANKQAMYRGRMDTLLIEVRDVKTEIKKTNDNFIKLQTQLTEHLEVAEALIPLFRQRQFEDSLGLALQQIKIDYLGRRVTNIETEIRRQ